MNKLLVVFRVFTMVRSIFFQYINRLWFYIIGVKYGRNMRVFNKIYISGKGNIIIGDDFIFTSGANVNPLCRNIRGTMHVPYKHSKILIGNRVGISSACLWAHESITIGNDVNIGGDCLIMDNDAHPQDYRKRRSDYLKRVGWDLYSKELSSKPIIIDDDVWIGARCQILKGVHIGARSIIAAGSVVTKDVPSDVVAGGIPCKVIKPI